MTHRTGFYGDAVLSNSQLDTDFDSEVSDSIAKRQLIVTVDPSDTSDRKLAARRDEVTYVSAFNMEATSFLNAHTAAIGVNSLGDVDTAVGYNSVYSLTSSANITSAYGYQVNVEQISSDNSVDTLYGYVFPDMTGVPNQGNISSKIAFANFDPQASIVNYGSTYNSIGQEIVPPNHPGIIPGWYYTTDYSLTVTKSLTLDNLYFAPVYIPYKSTIHALYTKITTPGSVGALVQLSLYKVVNGVVSGVLAYGEASAEAAGSVEVILDVEVPAGTYLVGINCNQSVSIIGGIPVIGQSKFGNESLPDVGETYAPVVYAPFDVTYGDTPSLDTGLLSSSDEAWPLVWYRVEIT